MNRMIAFAAVSAAVVLSAFAQEIIYTPGEKLGLENVPPPERNRWKARLCRPADYDRNELTECREADFFTLEFGKPQEPFALKLDEKGEASWLWGERADEHTGQAIRLGRGWSGYNFARTQVRAEIVQTSEGEMDWSLVFHTRTGKKSLLSFKTKQGKNDVATNLSMVRLGRILMDGGLELVAKGPAAATATVKDLRILPVRNWVSYRRRFTLDFDPWKAGASVAWKWGMSVKVNGREMLHTGLVEESAVAHIDLTGALVKGENEIVVMEDGNSGWDARPSLAAEVFAVSQSGETAFFASDAKWESKTGDRDWKKVIAEGVYGVEAMPNGTKYATGFVPLHAGSLAVAPHGTKWPVFDETKQIAWDVDLPPKMDGVKVRASVRNVLTGAAATTAEGKGKVVFKGLKTGAYEIEWSLLRGDEVVDSDRSEMVVTGRIGLDEFEADDVEAALRKRMRLVDDIDCTAEPDDSRAFLDHSGYYSKHVVNVGRVIERDGFKVRETGPGWIDLIAWQIKCGKLGAPHIAEIDFPDTREQVIYASVTETFPLNFCNNSFPVGSKGWANASGSVCSGGLFPLSGKMKTLRFTFFPSSRNITLNIENGCRGRPAGVCRVRIYEVDGTLPAMKIPQTERIYANHNERPLFFNWGCAVNPFMQEYYKSYREGMWAGAYKAIVNRVQFLKFAGHNAALEGAFMYYYMFKTKSGNSESTDESFDPLVPMLMMYKANGIRSFVGYEYTGTPALMADDIRGTSDRDVAAGKNTLSFVDRYGRQSLLYGFGGNMNFLDPRTKESMTSLMKEIYDRYEPLGVEGVVVQTDGCAWQPHFGGIANSQDKDEIGYDDTTVSMFEMETGITLGVDAKDPKRFAKRYDAIHATPERLAKWKEWRFDKLAEVHKALAETVRMRSPWRYAFSPQFPESDGDGDALAEWGGYTSARYPKDGGIEMWPKTSFGREWNMAGYAQAFATHRSATTCAFDGAYLTPYGLNEHNFNKVDAAKRWLWRSYGVIVYDLKPVGEYAFFDCVTACRDYTPKNLLRTWLDMNLTTGHDAEARRFLNGFYSTPLGEPKPYLRAKGVTAHIYGKKLQLMNLTPYGIVEKGGTLRIPPFGIIVLDNPRQVEFAFEADGAAACAKVVKAMSDSRVLELLSNAKRTAWAAANDDYERMVLSRDAEVLDVLIKLEAAPACFANQSKLEAALAKGGVARINCGYCAGEWKDEIGATWLPDQDDTGFKAYGCVNASRTS